MALIKCSSCGGDISYDAKTCPHCGHNAKKDNARKSTWWIWVIIIIGVIGLFGSCFKSEADHNDGKCDICNKTATYSDGKEEYCDKHYMDALEWYIKQSNK